MHTLAKWIYRSLVLFLAFVLIMIAIGNDSSAGTITVNDDGGADHETIKDALDAANEGDIIRVFEGTYHENVVVAIQVSIVGNGTGATIIDGGASGDVVVVSANHVNLSGVTIRNSGHYPDSGMVVNSSNVSISNCSISDNDGDGLKLEDGIGNSIIDCVVASNFNNGLTLLRAENTTITRCNIRDNMGNAIGVEESDHNTIIGCDLAGNDDGIVLETSSYNAIAGTSITGSRGIAMWDDSTFNTVSGCNISNAGNKGIEVWQSNNNSVIDSRVSDCDLRGIDLTTSSTFVTGCIVRNAGQIGIYLNGQNCTIRDCNVSGSEYGIYLYFLSNNNSVYHNELSNNTDNGYDGGTNSWDNGYPSGGNHWSDFDEESEGAYDNDTDGIVDDPYLIPGGENVDRYPLGGGVVENQAPIAEAGPDQQGVEGVTIFFDGSGSWDDEEVVNWTWSFNENGSRMLYGVSPSYQFLNIGNYSIELVVEDGEGLTDSDSLWANISKAVPGEDTEAPQAVIILPENIYVGEEFVLDGSASTDNAGIVTWKWLLDETDRIPLHGPRPSYNFTNSKTGMMIALEVWDAAGNYDYAISNVSVGYRPASLSGIVRDSKKRPLEGVQITNHIIFWAEYQALTDEKGNFSFPSLRMQYQRNATLVLILSKEDFETLTIEVNIESGNHTDIQVTMTKEEGKGDPSIWDFWCGREVVCLMAGPVVFLHHRQKKRRQYPADPRIY